MPFTVSKGTSGAAAQKKRGGQDLTQADDNSGDGKSDRANKKVKSDSKTTNGGSGGTAAALSSTAVGSSGSGAAASVVSMKDVKDVKSEYVVLSKDDWKDLQFHGSSTNADVVIAARDDPSVADRVEVIRKYWAGVADNIHEHENAPYCRTDPTVELVRSDKTVYGENKVFMCDICDRTSHPDIAPFFHCYKCNTFDMCIQCAISHAGKKPVLSASAGAAAAGATSPKPVASAAAAAPPSTTETTFGAVKHFLSDAAHSVVAAVGMNDEDIFGTAEASTPKSAAAASGPSAAARAMSSDPTIVRTSDHTVVLSDIHMASKWYSDAHNASIVSFLGQLLKEAEAGLLHRVLFLGDIIESWSIYNLYKGKIDYHMVSSNPHVKAFGAALAPIIHMRGVDVVYILGNHGMSLLCGVMVCRYSFVVSHPLCRSSRAYI